MKNITIVLGTAREERSSESVAKILQDLLKAYSEVSVTYVDVRDHVIAPATVPAWGIGGADSTPTKWQAIAEKTDVFLFVLPEYNHGYPGEWKLLIDSLGKEYSGKQVHVVGVSAGAFSGVRVADHVLPVLMTLGFSVSKLGLYIGNVKSVFDTSGDLADENVKDRIVKFLEAVVEG